MRSLPLILIGMAFPWGACRQSTSTTDEANAPHTEVGDGHLITPAESDGPPWVLNDATRDGVRAMRALVQGHPANGLHDGVLKDSLEAQLSLIFERCTMEGEAHERLHDRLLPLYHAIRELPPDPSEAEVTAINALLEAFDEDFR